MTAQGHGISDGDGVISASLHIVIVNWNTGPYLRECLASVVTATGAVSLDRVTVVDNASSDGSATGVEDFRLPLDLVRNPCNIGFAAACNQGARSSSADYLLFLNPDTRLFPDTLTSVIRFMESRKAAEIGICGCQIVDVHGNDGLSCARFPTLGVIFGKITGFSRLAPWQFSSHHLTSSETAHSREVDQVIGAFYCVRRPLFIQLGGFDEAYFLYYEEVDFAVRARKIGARSYFLKEATVFHAANVSSEQVLDFRLYHSLRSRLLYARRHWPAWQVAILALLTLTAELITRLAVSAIRGAGAEVRATVAGYGMLVREMSRWRSEGWPSATTFGSAPTCGPANRDEPL